MEETNEVSQGLKQAIHDYYMGYIREKHTFLEEGQEENISNAIMQLVERKIADGNSSIDKNEIMQILRTSMQDRFNDPMLSRMRQDRINETFPDTATITIEEGQTAHLEEIKKKLFGENESKIGYLYVAEQYYDSHIQQIEAMIRQFERAFSSKDIEQFDEQFTKDATIKGYELDSAREFEDSRRQIGEKQKKFDAVKEKMIGDYGRKYQEIMAMPVSDAEKQHFLSQLLAETASYDKKTNAAALQLQEESAQLSHRFQNRAKSSKEVMSDMTAMHLFDRDKYIQDRKGEQNSELAELYAKREWLNNYRREHGQPVFEVKQNPFASILTSIARNIRGEKPQLLLEYHPERDIPTGVNPIIAPHQEGIDENLIKTLAHLYGEQAKKKEERFSIFDDEVQETEPDIDTTAFEAHLVKYFRAHYKDIMEEGYNHFLSDFAEMPDEISIHKEEGELSKIAKQFGIDPQKFKCFGYKFSIRDGLIYEEDMDKLKAVHYATDKGINDVIESLYGKALYKEHTGSDSLWISKTRELKNGFIEYAKQHGIKIDNEYTLETMPVNHDKVNDVSVYLNELVNKELSKGQEGYTPTDYTETIAQDLAENYSTIMNLDWYSFGDLASVKSILGDKYLMDGHLRITDDSVIKADEFSPRVIYASPEYCAREYANIMEKIKTLNATTDPFIEGYFDLTKANAMKTSLREYIQQHGIDIDTSIEQVPINQERIDLIADAMVERYGEKARNPKTFRKDVIQKLQDNWSEIMSEMQVVGIGDMFEEEFKEGSFIHEHLYVRDDFTYIGDFDHYRAQCIYATPEALSRNIAKLDETIATRDSLMADREKKARNILTQYADDNNIKIDVPSLASVRLRQAERKRAENSMFSRMFRDMLPDDPTAREKIDINDNMMQVMLKMSEGNPGAITGMASLINDDAMSGFMLLLGLDDMNIRGSQIWQVYKYYCEEDVEKFKEVIRNRDADMVQYLNEQNAVEGQEKAVTSGASFDRSKKPDLYRFTAEEVELYREAREERIQKAREEQERPKTEEKPKHQKRYIVKRKEREDKRKAYRDALVQKGKDTIERKSQSSPDLTDDDAR